MTRFGNFISFYEEIEYAAPSEIIKDIETLDKERNQALTALKEMLR